MKRFIVLYSLLVFVFLMRCNYVSRVTLDVGRWTMEGILILSWGCERCKDYFHWALLACSRSSSVRKLLQVTQASCQVHLYSAPRSRWQFPTTHNHARNVVKPERAYRLGNLTSELCE
ncbi:hypothetical protein BDP27DRAFT_832855 [Rhodocollybia butyracea]|uniref:Secreted protein n=1 Tax=Rhodocollybia butyracea TaxID=206335 RepID=A0A9P5P4Q1_9AGAR|nr:hypothetical protein BDP27DRAFT_832855 [Rhodocollybia butyracea]